MSKFKFLCGADDPRFNDTVFLVEANSFETHKLWEEIHDKQGIPWQQDSGVLLTIGCIDNDEEKPVCVSFMWNRIDGQLVCFYEATSRYVDHEMVEAWLNEHCCPKWDSGTRTARCDANNYHHCLHAIEQLKDTP